MPHKLDKDFWEVVVAVVVFILLLVAGWFAWPYVADLLSRPSPGAPQPGQDCYEADWDEWGRPLWVCEPEASTWPPERDDPPVYVPEPDLDFYPEREW